MFAVIEIAIALYTVLSFGRFVWSDVSAQSPDSDNGLNGQFCELTCEVRILDGSSCEIACDALLGQFTELTCEARILDGSSTEITCEVPEFVYLGDWYLNRSGKRYSRKSDLTKSYKKAVAAIA